MGFEPQKFFIGLVDLFSIFLPGAFVLYFYQQLPYNPIFDASHIPEVDYWIRFIFFSYLIGHLLFLVSTLLDELLYDPLRSCTYWEQVKRLARGSNLRPGIYRRMADSRLLLFGKHADEALKQVVRVKDFALKKEFSPLSINAFQWSKAVLSKELPEGLISAQRFEADSKFFRSFSVALLALSIYFFTRHQHPVAALQFLLLIPFTLWRYIDLRYKATQQAYWYIITLESLKSGRIIMSERDDKTSSATHAGGVVFRKRDNHNEFLLIQDTGGKEWVLPKGHIEWGETKEQTAVREVKEETGTWAGVIKPVKKIIVFSNPAGTVQYYLMKCLEEGETSENRSLLWKPLQEAIAIASFEETRELLKEANRIVEEMEQGDNKI